MTLITEQDARDTINSYHERHTTEDEYEAIMHEVRTQIEAARCLLHSAMMEMPSPLTSPAFEAVALANDRLRFALSAWD